MPLNLCGSPRAVVALLALTVAAPAIAQGADVERYVMSAARLYEDLEYERALEQLQRAKQVSRGVADDVPILLYEGLILADLGKEAESTAAFKAALFLKPDAVLPVKASPKVVRAFESVRVEVKRELASALAREEAERKARDEAARREETARIKEDARKAEEARKAAAERRAAEAAAQPERSEVAVTQVQPRESPEAFKVDEQVKRERGRPVLPFVFGGAAVAAAGTGTYFGLLAQREVQAARDARFQDDAAGHLRRAEGPALVANVLFGIAGSAGLAAVITAFTSGAGE